MLLMLLLPLQLLLPPLPLPLRTPFSLSFPPTVLLLIPSFSSFCSTPFSHISFARDPNHTAAADAHVARTQPYAGLPSVRTANLLPPSPTYAPRMPRESVAHSLLTPSSTRQ